MRLILIPLFLITACAQQPSVSIAPFSSDGCSLFPDGTFKARNLWCSCCYIHDLAYWQGGTKDQRRQADVKFRNCVEQKTGDKKLAELMFHGVAIGGHPYLPNWYRWGYGWPYGRGYETLSLDEQSQVDRGLPAANTEAEYCSG